MKLNAIQWAPLFRSCSVGCHLVLTMALSAGCLQCSWCIPVKAWLKPLACCVCDAWARSTSSCLLVQIYSAWHIEALTSICLCTFALNFEDRQSPFKLGHQFSNTAIGIQSVTSYILEHGSTFGVLSALKQRLSMHGI